LIRGPLALQGRAIVFPAALFGMNADMGGVMSISAMKLSTKPFPKNQSKLREQT
jgi:hypothetical protein